MSARMFGSDQKLKTNPLQTKEKESVHGIHSVAKATTKSLR